jgi:hypothetical protein
MRWELSGSVFVIVHGPQPPTDAEYRATVQGYGKHLGRFRSILIHSDGGAPNPAQRKQTTEFWESKHLPNTAIMTSSSIARGVITALNWFFPQKLKAVKDGDFPAAFEHLDVPLAERAQVEQTVARLRNELATLSAVAPRV